MTHNVRRSWVLKKYCPKCVNKGKYMTLLKRNMWSPIIALNCPFQIPQIRYQSSSCRSDRRRNLQRERAGQTWKHSASLPSRGVWFRTQYFEHENRRLHPLPVSRMIKSFRITGHCKGIHRWIHLTQGQLCGDFNGFLAVSLSQLLKKRVDLSVVWDVMSGHWIISW